MNRYNEDSQWEGECGMELCHESVYAEIYDHVTKDHQYLCEHCFENSHRPHRNSTDVDVKRRWNEEGYISYDEHRYNPDDPDDGCLVCGSEFEIYGDSYETYYRCPECDIGVCIS